MKPKKVLAASQLKEGHLKTVNVPNVSGSITLANVGGKIFAFADTCTHAQCSLGKGELVGKLVKCPCHGAEFDIASGEAKKLPATVPVETYKTKIEDGQIFIKVGPVPRLRDKWSSASLNKSDLSKQK